IKFDRKLYKKLLHEGYKYAKDLSHYLEEVPLIDIGEYCTIYPLADFFHSALIPTLSILARRDIYRRYPITMISAFEGGMDLFAIEKTGRYWRARKDVKEALCWRLFKNNLIEALDIWLHALDLAMAKNNIDEAIVAAVLTFHNFVE
ncbi:3474_t:CDS:2, partial [Gigaspora rosea]